MKLALLILALLAFLAPTPEYFVVSSASCREVYLEWQERSVDYSLALVELTTYDRRILLSTTRFHLTPNIEWFWTALDRDEVTGREWTIRGIAYTDIGRIETSNSLTINCPGGRLYLPIIMERL